MSAKPSYHSSRAIPMRSYSHSRGAHSRRVMSQPTYSYSYPDGEFLHFYKWNSPPGIIKIMAIIIVILCVVVFACVASTLVWDTEMGLTGFSGMGMGSYGGNFGSGGSYGGFGGSYGSGGASGYGDIGGNYLDPRASKGFIIAIAAIGFLAALVIFILVISRQEVSKSRRFYLAVIIIAAILCVLMFIATIIYLVGVNPAAQTSGSIYYNQVIALCSQYQGNSVPASGIFISQYLYHYCVVEPQEVIAIVCGILVAIALIILLVYAVKTRNMLNRYGRNRVLWDNVRVIDYNAQLRAEERSSAFSKKTKKEENDTKNGLSNMRQKIQDFMRKKNRDNDNDEI